MMNNDERQARGEEMFLKVNRFPAPQGDMNAYTRRTIDVVFGEMWCEPGLSIRERRLISMAITAQIGGVGMETHLRTALESGDIDKQTMDAFLSHLAVYAGWPVAARAQAAVRQILASMKSEQA
jgi:4-carboxymuconolactone decarboxylase